MNKPNLEMREQVFKLLAESDSAEPIRTKFGTHLERLIEAFNEDYPSFVNERFQISKLVDEEDGAAVRTADFIHAMLGIASEAEELMMAENSVDNVANNLEELGDVLFYAMSLCANWKTLIDNIEGKREMAFEHDPSYLLATIIDVAKKSFINGKICNKEQALDHAFALIYFLASNIQDGLQAEAFYGSIDQDDYIFSLVEAEDYDIIWTAVKMNVAKLTWRLDGKTYSESSQEKDRDREKEAALMRAVMFDCCRMLEIQRNEEMRNV